MAIVLIRTLIIYISVVFALRFMGKRQLGQLAPHELVITILISSVATIPLQSSSTPLSTSLIPIAMLISLEVIQSILSMKSIKLRNLIQGRPMFVIKNGVIQQKAFKKLRLTIDDLIDALRQQGIFKINEVQNAIIETNGALSVQLKSRFDKLTPETLNIDSTQSTMPITVVMDGKKVLEYFKDEKLLDSEIELIIKANDVELSEIMYMSIDENANTLIIKKEEK